MTKKGNDSRDLRSIYTDLLKILCFHERMHLWTQFFSSRHACICVCIAFLLGNAVCPLHSQTGYFLLPCTCALLTSKSKSCTSRHCLSVRVFTYTKNMHLEGPQVCPNKCSIMRQDEIRSHGLLSTRYCLARLYSHNKKCRCLVNALFHLSLDS